MKTPTREEVIEHFKDAELIQCLNDDSDKEPFINKKLKLYDNEWIQDDGGENWLYLWNETNGYAKVLKYKEVKEPTETKGDFKEITDSISSLLDYKNQKYGNSALEPINVFDGKCKSGKRIDDKISRVKNNEVIQKNDVADLIGYLVLTCKEFGWTNFDEFKD